MPNVRLAWHLARPYNAILPLLAVVIGYVFVAGPHMSVVLWLALAASFLSHSVVTVWNDLADREIDKTNGRPEVATLQANGGTKVIWLNTVIALLIVAIICIWLPPLSVAIRVSMVLLSVAYNFKPLQLSRRPIASVLILALVYGAGPILIGASLVGLNWKVAALAVGWFLMRGSLSILKDYKDAYGDAKHNKKTFLLVYGGSQVARLSLAGACIGFAIIIATIQMAYPYWARAMLAAGVAVLLLAERTRLFDKQNYTDLNAVFHRCLRLQIIFEAVIIFWLVQ